MDSITSADQCVQVEMLSWVSYPRTGASCYVYPQFLRDDSGWRFIDKTAFPNNGCFQGIITGGSSPSDIEQKFSSTVVAKVNVESFPHNGYYEPDKDVSSKYRAGINPFFDKGNSELEFEEFSEHLFSKELIQIVTLEDDVSLFAPVEDTVHLKNEAVGLICKMVMIECKAADKSYFGPFEYSDLGENGIKLSAIPVNDWRIARFDNTILDKRLDIQDKDGIVMVSFMDRTTVDDILENTEKDELLDWLPDNELLEVLNSAISASEEFSDLSKSQIRSLKTAVRVSSERAAHVQLNDDRKRRLEKILSGIDDFFSLPDFVKDGVFNSINEEKLASIILDNRNYPNVKERILKSAEVQQRIDNERKQLEQSLKDLKRQEIEAIEQMQIAEQDAAKAKEEARSAEKQAAKLRAEVLSQKGEELAALEKNIEKVQKEKEEVDAEYRRAIVDQNKIQESIDRIFAGINDEISTSAKILESEILRKVVATVSGVKLKESESVISSKYQGILNDEDALSDGSIVDNIHNIVTQQAGRDCTRNDIINYMICLMQGYITTFAGLPGTGKTSLCDILAGALGLQNEVNGKRFTEINVENGWTSYKDYVGYFNPLAKTYEKTNPEVYDAMYALRCEGSSLNEIPPYIFLLDEANLSPVEHYWSPFLRACDSFANGTLLSLGGQDTWVLPEHIRFFATVNFDHTTEALSQRFLDRSWVITLDPDLVGFDLEVEQLNRSINVEFAYSYARLIKAFGWQGPSTIDPQVNSLFEELMKKCKEYNHSISPRSQIMMKKYLATASRLMSTDTKGGQFAPLDYAFSQKVLPMIAGPIEAVGELAKELSEMCSSLKTAKKHLDKMIIHGEESGFYQYFT